MFLCLYLLTWLLNATRLLIGYTSITTQVQPDIPLCINFFLLKDDFASVEYPFEKISHLFPFLLPDSCVLDDMSIVEGPSIQLYTSSTDNTLVKPSSYDINPCGDYTYHCLVSNISQYKYVIYLCPFIHLTMLMLF